jgi:hypothetical protein
VSEDPTKPTYENKIKNEIVIQFQELVLCYDCDVIKGLLQSFAWLIHQDQFNLVIKQDIKLFLNPETRVLFGNLSA